MIRYPNHNLGNPTRYGELFEFLVLLGWPGMATGLGYKVLTFKNLTPAIFCCSMSHKAYLNPLALDIGIPSEQFRSLLATDHYILLHQAHICHPSLVDMNTLATYLQPEIKSMLDSIHPFLVYTFFCIYSASLPIPRLLMKFSFPKMLTWLLSVSWQLLLPWLTT